MNEITTQNYYDDKTYISNSMLCNLVAYEKGSRILTPEIYYAYHISKELKFEATDAMLCGTIADRYFAEGMHILEEYPVKSKRSGDDPKEITNSMNDKVQGFIKSFKAFKTFQQFIKLPDTIRGDSKSSIRTKEITLPSGRQVNLKCKLDFINDKLGTAVDQKTTANCNTLRSELQWKGIPNIYHRYMRQMTIYNKITGYRQALAIADDESRMLFIPVEQYIMDRCWIEIEKDLEYLLDLQENNFKNLVKNPFLPFPEEDTEEKF